MKILIIDNFDSFTYNLLHIVEQYVNVVKVIRYNKLEFKSIKLYDKIIISPGPGLPNDYLNLNKVIFHFGEKLPIFGICLGMQAIVKAFGGKLKNLNQPLHGVARKTILTSNIDRIFNGLPNEFISGRYHSWVVNPQNLPNNIKISAIDDQNNIMALYHDQFDIRGVQFHPESILTPHGQQIIKNWIKI